MVSAYFMWEFLLCGTQSVKTLVDAVQLRQGRVQSASATNRSWVPTVLSKARAMSSSTRRSHNNPFHLGVGALSRVRNSSGGARIVREALQQGGVFSAIVDVLNDVKSWPSGVAVLKCWCPLKVRDPVCTPFV